MRIKYTKESKKLLKETQDESDYMICARIIDLAKKVDKVAQHKTILIVSRLGD